MGIDGIRKILNSVFTKLLLVLLITGIGIYLSATVYFHCRSDRTEDPAFQRSIGYFLSNLIRDIGNPPDRDRAKKISQQSSIQIRYESPGRTWFTSDTLAVPPQAEWRTWKEYPEIRVGINPGGHYFLRERGSERFIFELPHPFTQDFLHLEDVVILIALLTVNLAGAYLLIRWILNPVRRLTEGVREVSKGNMDYRVPHRRSDELGELAKAFNAMTDRIRKMLRAKEQLMLDVSHELRSPLTRIKVALESLPESHARKNIAEDIVEMEHMITNILKTAQSHYRHSQLNLQRINIVELLNGVLSAFKNQPPGFQTGSMPSSVELHADPDRVKSVLKNIFGNAVKYTPPDSEPVKISVEDLRPYIVIRVQDHGAGIPEDELPYIFEPFYRVDKSRTKDTGGYGLGLSLCKTVMEAHQGKIEIVSSPGGGTTVSLFFPRFKNGEAEGSES